MRPSGLSAERVGRRGQRRNGRNVVASCTTVSVSVLLVTTRRPSPDTNIVTSRLLTTRAGPTGLPVLASKRWSVELTNGSATTAMIVRPSGENSCA